MNNTLFDVQSYIAGKLNADEQLSGKVAFLAENRRDIDFQIKQALGKQGIVGLVITPKASFLGKYEDKMLAWELPELEVDIVENVSINRGKAVSSDIMTGQDASMRVFDVLCPLSGQQEGQFCPVGYEQGEDGSLLVNKCLLKCAVYGEAQPPEPWFPDRQAIKMSDGTVIPMGDGFFSPYGYDINTTLRTLGYTVDDIAEIYVFSKLDSTTAYREHLKAAYIDSSCPSIGRDAWSQPFSGSSLEKVVFKGRTYEEVEAMEYYPWGLQDTSKIVAEPDPDPDPRLTLVTYAGGHEAQYSLSGTLNSEDLPIRDAIHYVRIGSSIDEIGDRAFSGMEFLMGVEIPDTVTTIGSMAFSGAEGMTDIEIPSSVLSIGSNAFSGCHSLSSVTFDSKTLEQVQAMANYPWGISDTSIISAEL